jgi:hypothetical protein
MPDLSTISSYLPPSAEPDTQAREAARARLESEYRRARTRGPRRRIALGLVLAAGLLAIAGLAAAAGDLPFQVTSSEPGASVVGAHDAPYVSGDQLVGLTPAPTTLARPVADQPWDTADLSHDGSTLVYESAVAPGGEQAAGSALRVHDLASGADALLEPLTFAPVLSPAGRLAYGRTIPHAGGGDVGAVFPSRIEVRDSPEAAPVVWTETAGNYRPLAWAGASLLVARLGDDATTTIWAFDGPGHGRELGAGWAVAVDPSGTRVLLGDGIEGGAGNPGLRVVEIATGATRASLDLQTSQLPGDVSWTRAAPSGPGVWTSDSIVLPASSALVTLRLTGAALGVSAVDPFHGDGRAARADYHELRLADDGRTAVLLADVIPPTGGELLAAALACDLETRSCTLGGSASSRRSLALVVQS